MLLYKNSFKKAFHSLGRFFSLLFIVLLGSAFFSGLRETSSDMIRTMDKYYDDYKLMDYKIVSTMGLTDDDVSSLKELYYTDIVVPSKSLETLVDGKSSKIFSILDDVNLVSLTSGRMPTMLNEILVEEGTFQIGDVITLDSKEEDSLENTNFTVVGTIRSPLYIYENKGISSVGNGRLDTYMYVLQDNFKMEYYTEVYIIGKNMKESISYSDDYKENASFLDNELKMLKPIRETARYEEIYEQYMNKIYESENELAKVKQENEQKFLEARNTISENEKRIEDAKKEYQKGLNLFSKTQQEMNNKFKEESDKLLDAKNKTLESLKQNGITVQELDSVILNLQSEIDKLVANQKEDSSYEQKIQILKSKLEGLLLVQETLKQIENGEKKLENSKKTWQSEEKKQEQNLNKAKNEISTGEEELNHAKSLYDNNYQTYLEEINKAESEIQKALDEANSLEKPVWYLFNRNDMSGYATFYECATKIDSIAKVFPIFFILIALFMCMNTMTRMIEEERTEIGVLSSLGYSKLKIMSSYLFYVFLATIIGLILGLLVGYFVVPYALYDVYTSQFIIPKLNVFWNMKASVFIIFVSLFLMFLVTFITVNKNFKKMPAYLLRPDTPKMGKKVIFEYIPFLWNKLSFTWKVTIRNLFRYKKRIFMTLFGISGCTALLLTGFGIKDGVSSLIDMQFGSIQNYDAILFLEEPLQEKSNEILTFLEDNEIHNELFVNFENYRFMVHDKSQDVYMITFLEENNLESFLHLEGLDGSVLSLDDDGVIVTEKMAQILNLEVGSTFSVRNSSNEMFILKVSGIVKNYVNNYIYMNSNYAKKINNSLSYNALLVQKDFDDSSNIGKTLLHSGYFSTIQYTNDSIKIFEDVILGMDTIVYLILGFSLFLSLTVLYNLTTINISERKREIATLKVLGFHDSEVSSYVYRETLVLTIFGILVGLVLGNFLNYFVLEIAETESLMFLKDIRFASYFYTFLIMVFFTVVIQIFTYFVLKRILMIESLKSVE